MALAENIEFCDDKVCGHVIPQAADIYTGTVMHARFKPFTHRFQYSVFNLLIDIDRLDEASHISPFFKINRFAPIAFHEADHGRREKSGLKDDILDLLKDAGMSEMPDQIRLLCYPRIFGYVFNPIAVYFCEHKDQLIAMVYEVRNTFGGKHIYVEPVIEGQISNAGLRQECDKIFHVSPFIGMKMRYHFRLKRPDDDLTFRILETDEEGPLLSATLSATRKKMTSVEIWKQLLRIPFLTLKVMIAIHFEALKLWMKGAKYHSNPHKKN